MHTGIVLRQSTPHLPLECITHTHSHPWERTWACGAQNAAIFGLPQTRHIRVNNSRGQRQQSGAPSVYIMYTGTPLCEPVGRCRKFEFESYVGQLLAPHGERAVCWCAGVRWRIVRICCASGGHTAEWPPRTAPGLHVIDWAAAGRKLTTFEYNISVNADIWRLDWVMSSRVDFERWQNSFGHILYS